VKVLTKLHHLNPLEVSGAQQQHEHNSANSVFVWVCTDSVAQYSVWQWSQDKTLSATPRPFWWDNSYNCSEKVLQWIQRSLHIHIF